MEHSISLNCKGTVSVVYNSLSLLVPYKYTCPVSPAVLGSKIAGSLNTCHQEGIFEELLYRWLLTMLLGPEE